MNVKLVPLLIGVLFGSLTVQAQNPYKDFGIEVEPLTLSKGKYNEFFTNDSLVRIGSIILDTRNNRIASFVLVDTAYSEATLEPEVSSRFLSPDPHAAKYPNVSPYVYALNNPIKYYDPDGRDVCCLELWTSVKLWVSAKMQGAGGVIQRYSTNRTASYSQMDNMTKEEQLDFLEMKAQTDRMSGAIDAYADGLENATDAIRMFPGMDASMTALEGDYGEASLKAGLEFIPGGAILGKVDDIIKGAGKLTRLKGGIKQGTFSGFDANKTFQGLAKKYGIKLEKGQTSFKLEDGTHIGIHESSRTGVNTLDINRDGNIYKFRFENE